MTLFLAYSRPAPSKCWNVKQRPIIEALGRLPTDKEIVECTRKAKKGKAPGDNRIPEEFWQALLPEGNLEEDSVVKAVGFSWYRDVIHKSWTPGPENALTTGSSVD